MAEPVELRAGLADFGGEVFVVVHHLVLAKRAAGRGARHAQNERPLAEARHRLLVVARELIDLPVFDVLDGVEHFLRRAVVRGTGLVTRPPLWTATIAAPTCAAAAPSAQLRGHERSLRRSATEQPSCA